MTATANTSPSGVTALSVGSEPVSGAEPAPGLFTPASFTDAEIDPAAGARDQRDRTAAHWSYASPAR